MQKRSTTWFLENFSISSIDQEKGYFSDKSVEKERILRGILDLPRRSYEYIQNLSYKSNLEVVSVF